MNPPFVRVSMNNHPEMPLTLQLANDLSRGPVYLFADWPNVAVSTFGAGVYTIWHSDGRFVYVGMSGRGITTETSRRNTPQGIYTRLQSHASGRRSGDQFCVYVADRLVLPALSQDASPPLHQVVTRWMHLCADTSMKTFATDLSCCQMEQRLTPLKPRSRAANGSMADHSSIPAGESGILLRASSRFYP